LQSSVQQPKAKIEKEKEKENQSNLYALRSYREHKIAQNGKRMGRLSRGIANLYANFIYLFTFHSSPSCSAFGFVLLVLHAHKQYEKLNKRGKSLL
jgi:hypothetical protein